MQPTELSMGRKPLMFLTAGAKRYNNTKAYVNSLSCDPYVFNLEKQQQQPCKVTL